LLQGLSASPLSAPLLQHKGGVAFYLIAESGKTLKNPLYDDTP
jgi:hypothetical protein